MTPSFVSLAFPAEAKAAEAAASASCATLPPTHVYLPQVSCPSCFCYTGFFLNESVNLVNDFLTVAVRQSV